MLIGPDSRCLRLLTSQQETVSKRPGLVIEASPVIVDEKGNTITDAPAMPPLTERQEQEAEDRTSVSALVVHEAIRKDGDEELRRSISALGWSGLAAGLSMGFSFVAEALFRTYTPRLPGVR